MEFAEVVRRRRMVRSYRPDPVDPGAVHRIVAAGRSAPSAGNTRGQSFVVVTDPAVRQAVAELSGEPRYRQRGFQPWMSRAPVLVVVCVSEDLYRQRYREPDKLGPDRELAWPVPYWWVDGGAALMAVLLATVDEGLAAGFLGVHALPGLERLLAIPTGVTPLGVVTIGHPAPGRRSRSLDRGQRPDTDVVHQDRWGGGSDVTTAPEQGLSPRSE